jgi:hypothetical protein
MVNTCSNKINVLHTVSCGNEKLNVSVIKAKDNLLGSDSYFLENSVSGEWVSPNYDNYWLVISFTEGYLAAHGIKGSNKELRTGQYAIDARKLKFYKNP